MKPCPFCGKQHTVVTIGNVIGWTEPDEEGTQTPISGGFAQYVVLECATDKVKPHIPLSLWESEEYGRKE